jgi:competence protein ComEC
MKRPTMVVVVAIGFCCGILLRGSFAPSPLVLAGLGILIGLIFLWKIKGNKHWMFLIISLVLGFGYLHYHYGLLAAPLPETWHNQEAILEGEVTGFPYKDREGAWHFNLINLQKNKSGENPISIEGILQITLEAESCPIPFPGSKIRLFGRFSTQPGRMNFGDPDWQTMQIRRNFVGRFYAEQAWQLNQEPASLNPLRSIWMMRRQLFQGLYSRMESGQGRLSSDQASFLLGLTLGVGDELPSDWEEDFQVAGLLHLLAVSGGNVVFFLLGITHCLRLIPLARRTELICFMISVGFFILLTGMEPSVIRAGTMTILVLLSRFWLRKTHWPSLLSVSVIVILLFQPFMIYEMGFRLSFFAVWGLFVWATPFSKFFQDRWHWPAWLATTVGATLAAQFAVLPYSLLLFHQVSLVAPLSNLVFAVLILPASPLLIILLLAIPFGQSMGWLFGLADLYLQLLIQTGRFFAQLPWAAIQVPMPPVWMAASAYLIQFLLRYWPCTINTRLRNLLGLSFLCIVFISWWHPWPYPLELVMLDVGQGESIFVRFPNGKTMLIDGGGSMLGESQIGNQVVIPYLQRLGISKIDLVLLTHGHGDHYQGLMQVQNQISYQLFLHGYAKNVDPPPDLAAWLRSQPYSKIRALTGGENLIVDSRVLLQVKQAQFCGDGSNNDSILLNLRYGQTEIWLTGDMEKEAEEALFKISEFSTNQTILKVAHHGGATSTTNTFLEKIKPEYAIISAGRSNRYGHPAPEVVDRLAQIGCKVFVTAQKGAIACKSYGQTWQIQTCRP